MTVQWSSDNLFTVCVILVLKSNDAGVDTATRYSVAVSKHTVVVL